MFAWRKAMSLKSCLVAKMQVLVISESIPQEMNSFPVQRNVKCFSGFIFEIVARHELKQALMVFGLIICVCGRPKETILFNWTFHGKKNCHEILHLVAEWGSPPGVGVAATSFPLWKTNPARVGYV